ncbi:glycosyltransferase family 2 protein [Acinetobacter baumannii]|uniref:glycosyltransferase family 2 protein n=1 Tax=Acinetobacter baumannii TaxID=470 RepID=UPI00112E5EF0|nr:glycosyltransferase family 2 protein [Acinetobacter baumannii]TPU94814.1 glycosyltransferase family 2 protein [Acinetobacter baumannii]UEH20169.1 Gtr232 [Acinetobacter baumannii]
MIKVSYLVALYNKQEFIIECIESILAESSAYIDIEVCIVDDGSTDKSLQIVREHYSNNEKVKIANFGINKGKNAAYNQAFKMATGNFICIFGADDVVIRGRTESFLEASLLNKDKAIYGGLISKNFNLTEEYFRKLPEKENFYSITMRNGLSGGCSFIPYNLCLNIFPIPENLRFEDWWIAYFLVKNNDYIVIDKYVTYYRIGNQNDCGYYGGDVLENMKKDYLRHFDYLNEFKKNSKNKYLDKSIDFRNAFLGRKLNKIFYFYPFDRYSLKIILFKFIGVDFIYKLKKFLINEK